jgi:hypothetical protein
LSLSKSDILGLKFSPPKLVKLPEGDVYVRVMTGKQREQFEKHLVDNDRTDLRATALAFTLSDADGNLIFTPADIPAINQLEARVLIRLHDAALEVNKITDDEVEELAGN